MKLSAIAAALGADLEGDGSLEIEDIQPLESAGPAHLSFLSNPRYARSLAETRAGAVIVGREVEGPGCALLRVDDAYIGFAMALELFRRPELPEPGVHPAAVIAEDAEIGEGARIGPHVSIGARTRIGARAVLHPGVRIYPDVAIGDDFVAHANAVVRERTRIGHRVVVASGAGIGNEGFGNIPLPGGGVHALPQIGIVEIGDDVTVGSNTTIDRATIGVTRIADSVRLDNLVMVAHGCSIGKETLIAAQSGIAGSTVVGERVQLGGQVGVAGHLRVGDDARAAAQSGIASSVADGETVGGYPQRTAGRWRREVAALARLPELLRRVRRLVQRAASSDEPPVED